MKLEGAEFCWLTYGNSKPTYHPRIKLHRNAHSPDMKSRRFLRARFCPQRSRRACNAPPRAAETDESRTEPVLVLHSRKRSLYLVHLGLFKQKFSTQEFCTKVSVHIERVRFQYGSGVAQRERGGPMIHRTNDRNVPSLISSSGKSFLFFFSPTRIRDFSLSIR